MALNFKLHIMSRCLEVVNDQIIPCNTSEQTAERMIESQALRLGAKPREGFEAQVSRDPMGRSADPVAPMIMRYTDNIARGRPAAAGRLVLPWEGG